ncbi:MAG: carcinine hydrolase/isopenicillin-N N-acyltransferase family protein, partial [Clostridia bacterium]|nr:carcinine hydrolase/isopenicillin-N N-acyltransferase family protein [Clostridia bacterium]
VRFNEGLRSMAEEAKHILHLTDAFMRDGFKVTQRVSYKESIGLAAEHRSAVNYDTRQKKKAYYLEGTPYEMGYLMGLMAEEEITAMTQTFLDRIFFSFIGSTLLSRIHFLTEAITHFTAALAKAAFITMPQEIQDELHGLYDGCKKSHPETRVTLERLITLNLGFDLLLSIIYSGEFLLNNIPDIKPAEMDIPLMCNAFSIFGESAGHGHYFGRDFMFPSADVFQNVASMIICQPVESESKTCFPFVSVSAPGLVGSISAMNSQGVAMGVDMSPAACCDPTHIGVNSLLLTRACIQYGQNADQIIEKMRQTHRGVPWNYVLADGTRDKACVIESGKSDTNPDPFRYISPSFRPALPDKKFLESNWSASQKNGFMVRWSDYRYPAEYLSFNPALWQLFSKLQHPRKMPPPDAFGPVGYMNGSWKDKNCPATYYFAPQREELDDVIITTNHFIIPEMRLFAMHPWTSTVVGDKINDIQWRYDALNDEVSKVIKEKGSVGFEDARKLIDFLAPYGRYPGYYQGNPRSRDHKELCIQGCTSLFDLKNKLLESHYGYFCDEWVRITLSNYL